ncbi:GAF domain-containing protein [Streptomyces sp. RTd22]|uniref:GAF domain-containing protein n=1 Tax=Streptomyces sp. RTd22 TaxID=1841249 RepID=UPI000A8594F9|nr:GAF domain-containing protein [Streptomyces sp. RTd22]
MAWRDLRKKLLDALTKAPKRAVKFASISSGLAFWPLGIIATLVSGSWKFALASLAAVCYALNWAAGRIENAAAHKEALRAADEARQEEAKARAIEADFNVTVQQTLVPWVRELEAALDEPLKGRAAHIGAAKTIILQGLVSSLSHTLKGGAKRCLRACYFKLDSPGELISDAIAGRASEPRHRFAKGTEEGDYVFDRLERGERYLISKDDTGDAPLPKFGNYHAFISVPIATKSKLLGMLTVDSTEPDVLQKSDINYVRAMAGLLAISLKQGPATQGTRKAGTAPPVA